MQLDDITSLTKNDSDRTVIRALYTYNYFKRNTSQLAAVGIKDICIRFVFGSA